MICVVRAQPPCKRKKTGKKKDAIAKAFRSSGRLTTATKNAKLAKRINHILDMMQKNPANENRECHWFLGDVKLRPEEWPKLMEKTTAELHHMAMQVVQTFNGNDYVGVVKRLTSRGIEVCIPYMEKMDSADLEVALSLPGLTGNGLTPETVEKVKDLVKKKGKVKIIDEWVLPFQEVSEAYKQFPVAKIIETFAKNEAVSDAVKEGTCSRCWHTACSCTLGAKLKNVSV